MSCFPERELLQITIPTPTTVLGSRFHRHLSVCLFLRTISQKLLQLGSSNLTQKCPMSSPGNPFILG